MDCCAPNNNVGAPKTDCPSCGEKGKNVQLITLKSLLKAIALETIDPDNTYIFCSNRSCPTVYFSGNYSQTFAEGDIKVPVFQKDPNKGVPVCYCFDWTRERLMQAARTEQQPVDKIMAHVQAGRCGCEVNNPQGSCCLGNVNAFVSGLNKS